MQDILQSIKIVVTVTDSVGTALVGAAVTLSPNVAGGSGMTAHDGKCSMVVPNATYTAGATMTGFDDKSGVPTTNGEATCALGTVSGNGIIKATVSGSGAEGVLPGATVTATATGGTIVTGTTNSSGVAALSTPAATYTVVASKSDYNDSDSKNAVVLSGGTVAKLFTLTKIS